MPNNTLPLPDDARRAVREATYPNRAAEEEAVSAIDEAVFTKVRVLDDLMADSGDALVERIDVQVKLAREMSAVADELAHTVAGEHAYVTTETATSYQTVRASIADSIEELVRLRASAEDAATRCEDPYGQYQNIMNRFASLRSGRTYF